ncbi:MAG TPA: DUF4136 domain-containing protein [Novosphingobium sp.]|nr:DUF4136 domain-containing protein [Novosphingobium sp.]
MLRARLIPGLAAALLLAGCVTPVGPVQVTRFHAADVSPLGKGTIAIEPAPGADGASLEWQTYRSAVMRQLEQIGYTEAGPGTAAQVAQVKLVRSTFQPGRGSGPVSVGVGGSTGSYGSGVGVGVGLNLTPKPKPQVTTELAVAIRDRASGAVLWEGRASFTVSTSSPLADTALAAPKVSAALFTNFPGTSGETIEVK